MRQSPHTVVINDDNLFFCNAFFATRARRSGLALLERHVKRMLTFFTLASLRGWEAAFRHYPVLSTIRRIDSSRIGGISIAADPERRQSGALGQRDSGETRRIVVDWQAGTIEQRAVHIGRGGPLFGNYIDEYSDDRHDESCGLLGKPVYAGAPQ